METFGFFVSIPWNRMYTYIVYIIGFCKESILHCNVRELCIFKPDCFEKLIFQNLSKFVVKYIQESALNSGTDRFLDTISARIENPFFERFCNKRTMNLDETFYDQIICQLVAKVDSVLKQ